MARTACDIEITVRAEKLDSGRISMHLAQPLPAICVRHGRPATGYRRTSTTFHQVGAERVQSTFTSTFRWGLRRLSRVPPATGAELYADWPVCLRCRREGRWLRVFAAALVSAGAVPLLVLLVGAYLQVFTPPRSTLLGSAFIPLWFPGLIAVAGAAYGRATRYARVRPIVDDAHIVVRAHPRFAEAFLG